MKMEVYLPIHVKVMKDWVLSCIVHSAAGQITVRSAHFILGIAFVHECINIWITQENDFPRESKPSHEKIVKSEFVFWEKYVDI